MRGALLSARRRLLGLLLIVLIFAFFALTVSFYNKAFTPVVAVTMQARGAVGSQLQTAADVKAHGMVVGEVRQIDTAENGATLTLAIQPDLARQIPANATALLLPKSLFGERYVALNYAPNHAGTPALADGDKIAEDHSQSAIEVEQAVNNLLPVLQAVQPQKLNATLTAVATALQGKGTQLGDTIAQVNDYVHRLNPQLPNLTTDLRKLTSVSKTYTNVLPDLAGALQDLTTTTNTVAAQSANLSRLYGTLSATAQNLQNFLSANERNLIFLGASSRPTLELMAKYSPEYPCLFRGLAGLVPKADRAFGKGTNQPGLHADIEITVNRGPYKVGLDTPRYLDKRGPRCYDVTPQPDPFPQVPPEGALQDGASQPPAPRSQSDGPLPGRQATQYLVQQNGTAPQGIDAPPNLPNSPAEQQLISHLMAPVLGGRPQDVPGWASLLVGPLLRGSAVSVQ